MDSNNSDKDAIWSGVQAILDGFLSKDRTRIDSFIHEDATLWDSSERPLVHGLGELNALRDRRPADGGGRKVLAIDAINPRIDIYGDVALCLYELVITFEDGSPEEHIRNTALWRKFPKGWLAIHNHEDVIF